MGNPLRNPYGATTYVAASPTEFYAKSMNAELQDAFDYVYSLAVSSDGDRIISGSSDRTVRIWESSPLGQRQNRRRQPSSAASTETQ